MTDSTPDPEDTEAQIATPATVNGQPPAIVDDEDDTEGHVKIQLPGFGEGDIDVAEGRRRRI